MKLGAVFPQTEIGKDPGAVREYAQAVEEMGYHHILMFDHVVGADPAHYQGWKGAYTHRDMFHEPFVLFGYLAGMTHRLELATGVLILPQRQTVLVAKQAAEADLLSGGRLRLAVGIGWNNVEYEALGQDFHTRGARSAEQIALLRALWTQEVVTFQGKWDRVTAAGLNPLPVQRPIPIWLGGGADPVLKRVGQLADGWIPPIRPDDDGRKRIEAMRGYALKAGRDPYGIGIQGRFTMRDPESEWNRLAKAWQKLGATHLSLNTLGAGFNSVDQHIQALGRFREAASV